MLFRRADALWRPSGLESGERPKVVGMVKNSFLSNPMKAFKFSRTPKALPISEKAISGEPGLILLRRPAAYEMLSLTSIILF